MSQKFLIGYSGSLEPHEGDDWKEALENYRKENGISESEFLKDPDLIIRPESKADSND